MAEEGHQTLARARRRPEMEMCPYCPTLPSGSKLHRIYVPDHRVTGTRICKPRRHDGRKARLLDRQPQEHGILHVLYKPQGGTQVVGAHKIRALARCLPWSSRRLFPIFQVAGLLTYLVEQSPYAAGYYAAALPLYGCTHRRLSFHFHFCRAYLCNPRTPHPLDP